VTLTIYDREKNYKVDFFNNVNLSLKYDSVGSVFSFDFYYDPQNQLHRKLVALTQWQLAKIEHNGELLLTGFILSNTFSDATQYELVSISGYSVPGVLEDSQIPTTAYPLQSDNLSLRQIATKILRPFDIRFDVDPSVGSLMDKVYSTTKASPTDTVKDYLCKLASQRNIIVSHTGKGHLLFTRAKTDSTPIVNFDGTVPTDRLELTINGQMLHTPITVIKQADKDGGNAGQFSLTNPYIPKSTTAFRPRVIIQDSGDDTDTEKACRNALAAELKGITLKVVLDRWVINNQVIKPNTTILAQSDKLCLFKSTKFFVEEVDLTGDQEKQVATLNCVLPEVYNGQYPINIFDN
jgi:prophage tail gpP-like protein